MRGIEGFRIGDGDAGRVSEAKCFVDLASASTPSAFERKHTFGTNAEVDAILGGCSLSDDCVIAQTPSDKGFTLPSMLEFRSKAVSGISRYARLHEKERVLALMAQLIAILCMILTAQMPSCAEATSHPLDATKVWKAVSAIEQQRNSLTIEKIEQITGHDLVDLQPDIKPPEHPDQVSAQTSWNSNEFAHVEYRLANGRDVETVFLSINTKLKIPRSEVYKRFGKPKETEPTIHGTGSSFIRPWGELYAGFDPNNGPVHIIRLTFNRVTRQAKPTMSTKPARSTKRAEPAK